MAGGSLDPRSRAACALRVSRREMLGERQVAAPLMAQRAAHRALRPAHRRFQPGEGVGVQLAGLRPGGQPQRPAQRQFGHKTPVPRFALIAPAASRPGQHGAVRRQRGRQVAPRGHASTVGQRFPRPVLPDDQEQRRGTSSPALAGRTPVPTVAAHVTAHTCAYALLSFLGRVTGLPAWRASTRCRRTRGRFPAFRCSSSSRAHRPVNFRTARTCRRAARLGPSGAWRPAVSRPAGRSRPPAHRPVIPSGAAGTAGCENKEG